MPYVADHPSLPFGGTTPRARHCSYEGAKAAEPRAGSQCWRLFELYKTAGPQTDHEASEALRLPLATINARRGWLVGKGFVRDVGTVPGPHGVSNTRWGLA